MKNLIKLNVIFLVLFIIFASHSIAADPILPIPKPTPDKETKAKSAEKKLIYPQKKPTLKKEKIDVTKSEEISEIDDEVKEDVFIYPEKKPIIFQKKVDKTVAKSIILSRSDFQIAKASFEAIKKKKSQTAIKLSKKAKNKMVFKMVNWLYLIQPSNSASFMII